MVDGMIARPISAPLAPVPSTRARPTPGRTDGFSGQRIVVLPPAVTRRALAEPLFAGLLPTDIGWYPAAHGHHRERLVGVAETIVLHCLSGAGWVELRDARHTVNTGDLVALPPGEAHAYAADPLRPWTLRWFHLAGQDLPALLAELGLDAAAPVRPLPDDATLALLFDDALATLELGYATTHLLRASRALAHYLAHAAWLARHAPATAPDARQRIARCIDYMRLHLARPLRLAELAALAHWSPSHFKARFREHTGYGCIDYFIRLRIHAACQLLDTTALDIQTVATRVGYADPLWFSKAFKSITGQPPSEYRKRAKG
jgi:AraC family transcriptional regulator of arabinose operon